MVMSLIALAAQWSSGLAQTGRHLVSCGVGFGYPAICRIFFLLSFLFKYLL